MSYFLTGDCHGDFKRIDIFSKSHKTSIEDIMIILGDVGLNYDLGKKDKRRKRLLSKLQITYLCIHGNHEERPCNIPSYKEKEWKGGIIYYEEEYPNILFAKDGEIYDLDGKKAMAIGGAYSVDKDYRLMTGQPWYPDEQPSATIKAYVEEQLTKKNWTIDYVFSHTCPLKYEPTDLFMNFLNQNKVDKSTEEWLTQIEQKTDYKKWYFGHYHGNRRYTNAELLYEEIKELGSDDFVQRLGKPKYRQGEMVMFDFWNGKENIACYGQIESIDAYGAMGQVKEVSYDIYGSDSSTTDVLNLYKHVVESKIQNINELRISN